MGPIAGRSLPPRRLAAIVLAVALGSGGLILVASPTGAADPPPDPTPVVAGAADWGVKASFRSYITGPIANGSVTVSGGVTTNADATFHFPNASGTFGSGSVDAGFDGTVRFTGHAGALDMAITDLRVEVSGATGSLRADVVSNSLDTGLPVTYADTTFAQLDLASITPTTDGASYTWAAVPAVLTADGSAAFADFYPEGTPLDPITFTLTAEAVTEPTDPTGTSSTAPTTSTTEDSSPAPIGPTDTSNGATPTQSSVQVSPATATRGTLPATGRSTTVPALVGIALVAAGTTLVLVARRSSKAVG